VTVPVAPDGVLTYRGPWLERLKDLCVLFAREHYAVQTADAEDLFQSAYLDAYLKRHSNGRRRISPSHAAVLTFRERLAALAAKQSRIERQLDPTGDLLPALVRDDPAVQAQRDEERAMRSSLSYLVSDLWAARLEPLLEGESVTAIAKARIVSSSRVYKVVDCLRSGMLQHRERLQRLL
jgi:hypothetical protein